MPYTNGFRFQRADAPPRYSGKFAGDAETVLSTGTLFLKNDCHKFYLLCTL
jgi:hypothetical protein